MYGEGVMTLTVEQLSRWVLKFPEPILLGRGVEETPRIVPAPFGCMSHIKDVTYLL